ncbi:MAG TPA: septum formation initiator family protein [Candidatus Acidoferrales bacterium]|nr:septum formation initiator family protein [Candidatus Acidoferrales bacterium]
MDRGVKRGVSSAESSPSFFRSNARYFFALVFCLLLLQDIFGAHGLMAMHRSKAEIETIQAKIDKLDQENRDLQQRIQNLKTDPSAIEKIARDRMGLARPGEMIFSLPPKSDPHSATTPVSRP